MPREIAPWDFPDCQVAVCENAAASECNVPTCRLRGIYVVRSRAGGISLPVCAVHAHRVADRLNLLIHGEAT